MKYKVYFVMQTQYFTIVESQSLKDAEAKIKFDPKFFVHDAQEGLAI